MAEGRVSLEANGPAVLDGRRLALPGSWRASMVGVTDRDNRGVGNLTGTIGAGVEYTWQVEVVAGSGVFRDITRIVADNLAPMTGETYTVSAAEAGLAIRAVARFLDNKGAVETVYPTQTKAETRKSRSRQPVRRSSATPRPPRTR